MFATFKGEGAKLDISGLFLGRGTEHIDTTLVVDHAVPGCESRELFKGVLADRARGVFQGKVIVRPDAQKTDGKQMAQALMLSEDAEFDSKPELEIYADDVVCGHGSTAAEIDEDMLFYLRSRGIPLEEARALLIESFIGEAIDKVEDERLREALGGHRQAPAGAALGRTGPRRCVERRRTHMTAMIKETDIAGEAAYDVEAIRADFPILFREVYGKPLVYLDNGASAQKPRSVLDAIDYAYKMEYANVHRGLHFLSNAATAHYEDARETVRRFLNAPSVEEIIFTRNADRGHQSRRQLVRHGLQAGRRDRALDHGAPLQHRALALPPRAQGLRAQVGADLRRRRVPDRRVRDAADQAHQDGGDHAHVERAGHRRADQGGGAASRTRAASPCWSTAARPPCTCPSTCRISTATSTSSPATRPTGRPASACSTPSGSTSTPCRPTMGGGEMIESVHTGPHHLRQAAAQVRGRHAADRAGDRARRRARAT